jgi:hypothetical protein
VAKFRFLLTGASCFPQRGVVLLAIADVGATPVVELGSFLVERAISVPVGMLAA